MPTWSPPSAYVSRSIPCASYRTQSWKMLICILPGLFSLVLGVPRQSPSAQLSIAPYLKQFTIALVVTSGDITTIVLSSVRWQWEFVETHFFCLLLTHHKQESIDSHTKAGSIHLWWNKSGRYPAAETETWIFGINLSCVHLGTQKTRI